MTQKLSNDLITQEKKDLVFDVNEKDFVEKVIENLLIKKLTKQ